MVQGTGQGPGHEPPARNAAAPRRREDGQPAAAYTWHVAPGGVLVVVDLDQEGWRSVANDAWGIVEELAELRPDLVYGSVPYMVYWDSMGRWDALRIGPAGIFGGFVPIGAGSEADAVAYVLAQHG